MLKKLIVHLIINLLLIGSLVGIYIKLPEVYQSIDNRLRDFMFVSRGKQPDSKIISIVTIDEDSGPGKEIKLLKCYKIYLLQGLV